MTAPAHRVYRAGIIADTHIGSRYALIPPEYRASEPGPIRAAQEYLWNCWLHFVKNCPPLDVLIVNGDEQDGDHPTLKSAPEAADLSPLRQTDMAVATLGPLRDKAKKLWLIRGTGFHAGKWAQATEDLGRELNAERWSDRRWSGEVLDGTFAGLTWNVAHAQTTGAIYPGTLMNRTAWFSRLADGLAKTIPANIIIRSHTHSTGKGEYMGKWILSTRCWKLPNPHAISKMEYYRAVALCDLGAHVVTISDDGICWKDYPYEPYKPAKLRALA